MEMTIILPIINAFESYLVMFCFGTSVKCCTGYYHSKDRCIDKYDQPLLRLDKWSHFYRHKNREQKRPINPLAYS